MMGVINRAWFINALSAALQVIPTFYWLIFA
jgi:hypothetical protein